MIEGKTVERERSFKGKRVSSKEKGEREIRGERGKVRRKRSEERRERTQEVERHGKTMDEGKGERER